LASNPYWSGDGLELYHGDCRDVLAQLPAHSVSTVITSPPFYGLRKYDCPESEWDNAWRGVFGNEPTVETYVEHTIEILRALRRVLRKDGVLWWDIDDSRSSGGSGQNFDTNSGSTAAGARPGGGFGHIARKPSREVPPKNLLCIPDRVKLAAQADGWIIRSDIKITSWMPESAKDRPTDAYRTLLMMTPSPRYYYDSYAVRVKGDSVNDSRYGSGRHYQEQYADDNQWAPNSKYFPEDGNRNLGNVWSDIPPAAYPDSHFATYAVEEPLRCIQASTPETICRTCGKPRVRIMGAPKVSVKAGSEELYKKGSRDGKLQSFTDAVDQSTYEPPEPAGWTDCGHDDYEPGLVLDPFVGTGTSLIAARQIGRRGIGIDASDAYLTQAVRRLTLGDSGIRKQVEARRNGHEQAALFE
jgi:hypothetical protein